MKKLAAFIIPAHNEELVIGHTIASVLRIAKKEDIYVVDDGSRDQTAKVARSYKVNVLSLTVNQGKASAINSCIKHFSIPDRYVLVMPVDADTVLDVNFVNKTAEHFRKDKKVIAVAGRVVGKSRNWLTAYRVWEYEIGQSIHKSAQSYIGGIVVCPGCATIYRASLFNKVGFPTGTVTEDMDLTYELHRRKLGKIVYEPEAMVITQDPATIAVWTKQLTRWYSGFWQCVVKHEVPWGGQILDFEAGVAGIEGLFNGLLVVLSMVLMPIGLVTGQYYVLIPWLIDLCLFFIPSLIWVSNRHKAWHIWKYIFHFYFCRIASSGIFLWSFLKVIFVPDNRTKLIWNTERYAIR